MKLKVGQYYLSAYYSIQRIVEEDPSVGEYRFKSNCGQLFNEQGACKDSSDYRYALTVHMPKEKVEGLMAHSYLKEPQPQRRSKPPVEALEAMAGAAAASQKSHLLCGAFSFYGSTEDDKDLTAWATPKP